MSPIFSITLKRWKGYCYQRSPKHFLILGFSPREKLQCMYTNITVTYSFEIPFTWYNSLVKFISFLFSQRDRIIKSLFTKWQRRSVFTDWEATSNDVLSTRRYRKDVMRCHLGALHEWIDSLGFIVDDVAMKRIFCVGWDVRCFEKLLRTDVESLLLVSFHDSCNKAKTALSCSRHGG